MLRTLSIVLLLSASAQAGPLPIYVLAGQSNMSGWGSTSELYGAFASPQPEVLFHQQGAGYGVLRPWSTKYGPEISFGRSMYVRTGQPLAIVKHAKGSTSLAVDWNPDTGPLYAELLSRTIRSRDYWGTLGYDPYIAGVVWMQGEQDARYAEMAYAYHDNFVAFIERIRTDLSAPNAPFIYGQIRGKDYPYRDVVREAQATTSVPYAVLVGTDDLTTYEGLHFDSLSQIKLGIRFAKAMEAQLVFQAVPEPSGAMLALLAIIAVLRRRFASFAEHAPGRVAGCCPIRP